VKFIIYRYTEIFKDFDYTFNAYINIMISISLNDKHVFIKNNFFHNKTVMYLISFVIIHVFQYILITYFITLQSTFMELQTI
jgi:hypothetical protein